MSWTSPGQGFKLEEKVQQNNKPDNPRDQVGDAANRRTEYSHIYVTGLKPDVAKQLVKEFGKIVDTKWLTKDVWAKVGKDRKDVAMKGREVHITNSKLGNLGGSQADVAMVQKQIARWIESVAETSETVKIGSILNSQR
jgi:hypothetical protein